MGLSVIAKRKERSNIGLKKKTSTIVIGSKAYVGFTPNQVKKLRTDECKKCKHLIDDHRTGDLTIKKNMRQYKKKPVYKCIHCGCKIT